MKGSMLLYIYLCIFVCRLFPEYVQSFLYGTMQIFGWQTVKYLSFDVYIRHFGAPFGGSFSTLWSEVILRIVGQLPYPLGVSALEILGSELAHSVLCNIYGRARLFMTIPGRSHILAAPNAADLGANVLNVFEGMDLTDASGPAHKSGAGSGVALGFGYSKELIDALLAVAQPLVSLFPTPANALMLKRVWNFVGLFVLPSVLDAPSVTPSVPVSVFDQAHADTLLSSSSVASTANNPLIPAKSAPQLHAQNALCRGLFWALEARLRPCEAFSNERINASVTVWSPASVGADTKFGHKSTNNDRAGLQVSVDMPQLDHCVNSPQFDFGYLCVLLLADGVCVCFPIRFDLLCHCHLQQISLDLRTTALWLLAENVSMSCTYCNVWVDLGLLSSHTCYLFYDLLLL